MFSRDGEERYRTRIDREKTILERHSDREWSRGGGGRKEGCADSVVCREGVTTEQRIGRGGRRLGC